ncbi:MAG TPA: hypothetical protein VL523_18115 [Terriglobia bacterium]|nr:hypothetical protein [Terriglobia bacterium]
MKRAALIAVLLLAALYGGDYASVRIPVPRSRVPLGTVTVRRYYAAMKKDGKPDFYFTPPEADTCVHSLFPHFGYTPCWYLSRHTTQRIDL